MLTAELLQGYHVTLRKKLCNLYVTTYYVDMLCMVTQFSPELKDH